MKSNYFAGVAVIILLICLAPAAPAQREKDDERCNFVSTRDLVVTRPSKSKSQDRPRPARPIGLGCTIFKRGPRDTAVRVSARRVSSGRRRAFYDRVEYQRLSLCLSRRE